jgi:hypothetical protein
MRHAVGSAATRAVRDSINRNFRSGNYVLGGLMTLAHTALSSHMENVKHDQRIFENVARLQRGDPSIGHMTHNELREVQKNAHKYGGPHGQMVHDAAEGELMRRSTAVAREHAARKVMTEHIVHDARMAQRAEGNAAQHAHADAMHQQHLLHLRETQGHTTAAKLATARKLRDIQKQVESAKTKGVKERQGAVQKTLKQRKDLENLRIIRRTATGVVVATKTGGTRRISNEALAQRGKGRRRTI